MASRGSSSSRSTSTKARAPRTPSAGRSTSPSKKTTTKRKPASSKAGSSPASSSVLSALGRGIVAIFRGLASGVGWVARSIGGSARNVDPAMRRDGWGLLLLALAIVASGGMWFNLDGAADWIRIALTTVFGTLAVAVPAVLYYGSWRVLRHPADVDQASRTGLGWVLITLGVLGLVSIAHGVPRPDQMDLVREAGGILGFVASSLPVDLGTVWLALPLLVLVALYGVVLVIGRPVRDIVAGAGRLLGALVEKPAARKQEKLDLGVDVPYDTPLVSDPDEDRRIDDDWTLSEPKPEPESTPVTAGRRRSAPREPEPLVEEVTEQLQPPARPTGLPVGSNCSWTAMCSTSSPMSDCSPRGPNLRRVVRRPTRWCVSSPRCCASSRSTPASRATRAARRSLAMRWSWACRQGE